MKKSELVWSKCFVGVMTLMLSFQSVAFAGDHAMHDAEDEGAQPRAIVGERALSQAEIAEIAEKRAELIAESGEEELVEEADLATEGGEGSEEGKAKRAYVQVVNPYNFHSGAFHYVQTFGYGDKDVKLEDGSLWAIRSFDQGKMPLWYTGDEVVITPNHTWFSSYKYQLNNQNIGSDAEVNLKLGPYLNSPYAFQVVAIDYFLKQIQLCDGTWWDVSIFDGYSLDKWLVGDYVIIGVNDEYDAGTRPYILINATIDNWIKAYWM